MGMKLSDYVAKQPTSSVSVNNTVGTTPTQSFVSGSSLLGGAPTLSPSPKSAAETPAETPKVENKNSGLEIIGRGLAALPGSIAKGTTSAIDKITDTPSYVGKLFADSTKGKVTGGYYEAAKANAAYEKARDTHVLGQGVQNWQNKVDARRDQIVLDNPNSKVAEYTGKALQLGEAAGEMLPTVAASALVGGLGVAAVGGKGAIAAAGAAQSLGVASKAAKAITTASRIGAAAGLGVMAMDVYAKSVDESTKQGYDFVQSSKKAFGDAVLEIGTEMMFGGIAGLGEGVVSRVSKNVINRNLAAAAASEGAEQAVKMLGVEKAVLATAGLVNRVSAFAASTPGRRLVTSMLGEGAEEMVSEFFGPYIERMTTNPNADNATLGQMIEAGVGGALLSFFMSPLGKLQDSIGKPDADVVEKARTILKLQDADMNLTLARNLAFDSIADEDVPVIEQLLGRTVEPGTNFIRGLAARDYEAIYQDRLSKALTEAEQSGKTPEAMSRMWREFADVFDQVSIDRADEVAAEIHNSTAVAKAADNSKAVLSAREAVNAAKEKLAKAQEAADKALADKTNKSTGYAKAVADAKQELSRAQAALQEAEAGAKKSVELRLSRSDAVERFGKEAVDNFSAAQRVREIKAGRFYATDENGAERIYTRDQYASDKFGGKRYSQLTAKQKAVVDKAQADYQAKIKADLDAWSTKINEAIKSRGLGDKLRVEISDGHKFSVGYNKGVIHFSTDRVHTTQAADYYLAHEFTHAVEDKLFTTAEQKADFRKVLNGAMQTVGFDHDRWYARLEALYKNDYLPAIRAEAKRKGVKDIESYVEKELYERIESEVYARFMQTAFGSESILQSLAVFSPDLVEQMRNSINGSSVAELTDSLWDYERMRILERIDRAIAAPTDAETNKEKNAEAVEQAFKAVGGPHGAERFSDTADDPYRSMYFDKLHDAKQKRWDTQQAEKKQREEEALVRYWSRVEKRRAERASGTTEEKKPSLRSNDPQIVSDAADYLRSYLARLNQFWRTSKPSEEVIDAIFYDFSKNKDHHIENKRLLRIAMARIMDEAGWDTAITSGEDAGRVVLDYLSDFNPGSYLERDSFVPEELIRRREAKAKRHEEYLKELKKRAEESFSEQGFKDIDEESNSGDPVDFFRYRVESYRKMLRDESDDTIANMYSRSTGGMEYKEISKSEALRRMSLVSEKIKQYADRVEKANLGRLVSGEISFEEFNKKTGLPMEYYMAARQYGLAALDITDVKSLSKFRSDLSLAKSAVRLMRGQNDLMEWLGNDAEGNLFGPTVIASGNNLLRIMEAMQSDSTLYAYANMDNSNVVYSADIMREEIVDSYEKYLRQQYEQGSHGEQAFKDIDEDAGNLYNADENNVGGNEDDRNRRYYVAGNRRGDEGGLSEGTREQERLGTASSEGLFSEDYENRRSSLLERARGLRTLRDGAETETVTYRHDYGPRVYQYVKNRNDLPGAVRDTLDDMDELSRFSASIGAPELQSFFVLDDVRLEAVDGESVGAGGFYSPSYNIIVFPFQHYDGKYSINDSVGIRHEQTHAVQYLIPDCCDLFTDELHSSSGLSSREIHDLLTDYYKYHLRYYGDEIDSAEELQNELFSDLMAGELYRLPKRYREQLIGFRERFAPVLTQFVNERGLNIDFTDWLKPTKTGLEDLEIDMEGRRLDKSLFRGAVAEWASDNGFNIDDLDFFPNGPELYVVPKQASEILSVDDIMGIPRSEYVAILSAGKDKVGPYLEEKSSGGPIYSGEMFFRSVDSDTEFSEEQLRQYEELKRKYGKDDFGTPNKINDHSATSRFASRLIGNEANIWGVDENGNKTMTGVRTPEELQEAMKRELLNGVYTHIVHTDEAAMTAAKSRMLYHEEYTKKGNAKKTVQHKTLADAYSYARGMLESGRALNKNDIAFAQQLIVDMTDRYNQIEAGKNPVQGESTDTTELFNQLQEMIALTCAAGTRAGQNLQAFSLLKKMTPQGRLFYIEQQSNQIISELVDRRGQSRVGGYRYQKDDLGRYKTDANGRPIPITISSELRTKMLNCTSTEELDAVEKEIISDIASQIGPTITDRVVAWRYLAMLGNPRTHVRNFVSNAAMGVSVQLKNAIGGVLEDQILSGKTTGRTKTAKQVDPATRKALLDFADNDWTQDSVNEIALSGGKVGFQNRINEERRKLGTEKFHPLDTVSKKNTELLEKADDVAAKYAYKRAFAGYAAANGLSVEYLGAGTVESNTALAQARSYAIKEAAKATYHDASDVATMLNELEKKSGLAGKIVVGGLVPFKKTPINILKRGVEYSPLGLLSGITKTVRALNTVTEDIYEVNGKKVTKSVYESEYGGQGGRFVKPADYGAAYTATTSADALDTKTSNQRYSAEAQKTKAVADAIDQMAAGLTGTGLMILGLLLAKLGMMSGAGSDNDDEKYYDEMTGTQEYSITIGNTNYTLDWLTPVSMPMFAGVALWEMFSPDEEVDFPDLLTAVSKLADPVMNLSVLQGVNDAISSYDSGLGKAVLSSAESFAGQFIPTLSGQLARSVDPTRRTTYAPKDSDNLFGKEGATFLNRMKNKIPGLSQKNAAYVDQWGRTEESDSGFIGRLFANSVNPGYTRQTNKTQADDYISMLLNQTGDRTVIPKSPDASYVFGDDKFYLTSDEYQMTKQLVGQISNVGVTSLLSVPGFAQLSADEQADLVSDIYSFARKVAKADYAVANGLSYTEESSVVRIKNAVAAGMSIGAAMYVNYVANSMTADKDANGKSISGSKKAKVLNLYTMMGLTPQQIAAISIYDTN